MDIIEAFLKKIENEIGTLLQDLKKVEDDILSLSRKKLELEKKINELQSAEFSDPLSLHMKTVSILKIFQEIKEIKKTIENKEEIAENLRVKIKEKNAEKKAIKKYQEKIQKEKNIEEIKKDTQLADEIFNRNS